MKSIEGAQYLIRVEFMSLHGNSITDLTPLAGLTNLEYLILDYNDISDLTPLAGLTKLWSLSLEANDISDLTPLASLTKLKALSLGENHVTDYTPLKALPLTSLVAFEQTATMAVPVDQATALPLKTIPLMDDEGPIIWTVTSGQATIAGGKVTLSAIGTATLKWSGEHGYHYSGTLTVTGYTPGTPTITGAAQVGSTLTAKPGTWTPAGITFTYQWLRDGQPIQGATGTSYTIKGGDLGHTISVQVTGTLAGSTTAPQTSAAVTVSLPPCQTFTDVKAGNQFADAICWLSAIGITKGSTATTYAPSNPVNRGSMAAFLYRLAGSPPWTPPAKSPFVDVPTSHTFYSSITWLAAQKITVGVTIGGKVYFQPSNAVNRGSMAAFMRRLVGNPAWTGKTNPFADVTKANQFHDAILWLADQKITVGSTVKGKLVYQSANPVTRGSMAAFLRRLANTRLQCPIYPTAIGC